MQEDELRRTLFAFTGALVLMTHGPAVAAPDALSVYRKARKFLVSGLHRGFRSELENLSTAMEMAGLRPNGLPDLPEPRADTAMMVCDGSLRGGHYIVANAALDAFARLNRFRGLVVHTIRICDAGPSSERYLRGLAELSGGTYRWSRKPPPP